MVDKPKLDQMLHNLKNYVEALRKLAAVPREEFLKDLDKIGNAKYQFVISIECSIDIANHVIASENFRFPKDNADSFAILVEHGVLPEGTRESLRAMAGFRHRLVHLCRDVDDESVYSYLKESLGDIDGFAAAVTAVFG